MDQKQEQPGGKEEHQLNSAAYRRQKQFLRETYPHGHWIAFAGGAIIADAASMDELQTAIEALGRDPVKTFIVRAGIEKPDYVVILAQDVRP